jgi:hypothetical protein
MHMISMEEFLKRQQSEVDIPRRPNATDFWGQKLWRYLKKSADVKPEYSGQVVAMGRLHPTAETKAKDAEALKKQAAGRKVAAYDSKAQNARHVHFPAGGKHRLLNHFYAFGFFGDPAQRSFYRRLIRDSMRYRDEIQCAGARVVDAVRAHSRRLGQDGTFYALHIRRGDFQFKAVKISAGEIVENLRGTSIIPRGALVYLATDDPDGVCKGCWANKKPCKDQLGVEGCPKDASWDAFTRNGWHVTVLRNYTEATHGTNPNYFGMVDSIVCARAAVFAGTWFSTFTGYIHRLRGYHGLGEETYYHSTGKVDLARSPKSIGSGYSREWRIGWTDDGGANI